MKFKDIPGHEDVKARLRALVDDNRLPHALLLQGPEGSGKFALARALAQYIHCTDRRDGEPCGLCPSCRQFEAFNHIDTVFSFPVVKKAGKPAYSNDYMREFADFVTEHPWMDFDAWLTALDNPNTLPRIYVDEGIELIRRLSFTAHGGHYKVALLWQPERMNEDTANKMLKLVEEPFPDTVFIMTSDNPREILPTIYSRVQRVDVPRYDVETMRVWLGQQGVTDDDSAADIARLSEGNLNKALKLMEHGSENRTFFEWFIELMRKAYTRDIAALKVWGQKIAGEKRETQIRFLNYCCRMLRENFMYNFNDPAMVLETAEESQFSSKFARFITVNNVVGLLDVFSKAARDITSNANGKIVFFDVVLSVILLLRNG